VSKVYYAEKQVQRRTCRVTIGRADLFAPEIARKKALALLGEMAEGHNPNAKKKHEVVTKLTLADAFDSFFAARPHLSPYTVQNYSRSARIYLKGWRKKPINEITRQMVMKRHQELSVEVGKTTANGVMRHLRSVYNFAAAMHDEFPPNPVQILTQARAWHREQRRQTLVTAQDLPMWWKAVMAEPDYSRDFLLMALFTGMRRGELMKLRWENLNLETRTLYLPKTKNGDPLMLPLSNFLTDLLKERHARAASLDWVFPGPGKGGHLVETKKFLLRVNAGSGVSFTLHDLRRTFITIAESLDVPYYALKRLLNHRANSDVTGGYIVVDAERLRGPVQRVAERILELTGAEL
jgi:integrase